MSDLIQNENLFYAIKELIEQTKQNVAVTVNSALSMMYWTIGKKINDDILKNRRADYGKEIMATLSQQLSWSHFRELKKEISC
jgi:phosphoenolpyruvate-protein kinase (PTS system EI component)